MALRFSRSAYYQVPRDWGRHARELIEALNQLVAAHPRWGSWKYIARFRTLNMIDDYNREVLALKVEISLRAERVIQVLDRLKTERELPHMIRVDNGPEFLAQALHEWGKANRVLIYHIQPGGAHAECVH